MKTEKQQTAVEWYANQIEQLEIKILQGYISNNQAIAELPNILDKAKQMEQKQLKSAYERGKKYKKPLKDSNPIKFK